MNNLVEPTAVTESILEFQVASETDSSAPRFCCNPTHRAVAARSVMRERWTSSLSDQDLKCLLSVIEGNLIPQLVNSYSPARYAPIELETPE